MASSDQLEQELLKRSFAISDRIPASMAFGADLFVLSTGVGAWAAKTVSQIMTLLGLSATVKHTAEGGIAVRLVNATGAASVKGSIVSAGTGTDGTFLLQAEEFDAMGVVYESGVANGQPCWVVVCGIAEVLLKDGTAATRGSWTKAADTDGRAEVTTPPVGVGALATSEHFREVGHCIQSAPAGVNVLAKVVLHFN